MEKLIQLFEEFVMKAITMTEAILSENLAQETDLDGFTANRERLFLIIDQISRKIDWASIPDEKRNDLNRQIEFIKKLDEKLLVKLQEYQQDLKNDIEKTVRQKDNVKGYNLNDVK